MHRFIEREMAGWGNYPREEAGVYRPALTRDLVEILHSGQHRSYLPRGGWCGWSRSTSRWTT